MLIVKGDRPVAELMKELWAYSTQGRCVAQEDWRQEATQCKADSRLCLAFSVCPLDCGWLPEVGLEVVPRTRQKAFHT